MPGLQEAVDAILTIKSASNDPDSTMQVALTLQDLAMIGFSIHAFMHLYPEVVLESRALAQKLRELSDAQDFLRWDLDVYDQEEE